MKTTMLVAIALGALSAFAGFDQSVCRIPEKFKDHPLFTKPVVGVNFGYGGKRGYYAAHMDEAGMTGAHGWCRQPWNGMAPEQKGVRIDHREQADFTDAFFEVFMERPYCNGICLWKWDESQPRWFKRDNPAEDRGFAIPGKPVEKVLTKWSKRLLGR